MTLIATLPATGRPKRDIIELAFADCGLSGYEFDRTPEEQSLALRQLNAMMMEPPWDQLGYAQPTYGAGQAEGGSGIPDFAINTVAQYLALRIAPSLGVTLPPEQRATMARSLMALQSQLAIIPTVELPGNTVRGSGRYRGGVYGYIGNSDG
jgi:hypothetical protein